MTMKKRGRRTDEETFVDDYVIPNGIDKTIEKLVSCSKKDISNIKRFGFFKGGWLLIIPDKGKDVNNIGIRYLFNVVNTISADPVKVEMYEFIDNFNTDGGWFEETPGYPMEDNVLFMGVTNKSDRNRYIVLFEKETGNSYKFKCTDMAYI